jgi:hypothetical protein
MTAETEQIGVLGQALDLGISPGVEAEADEATVAWGLLTGRSGLPSWEGQGVSGDGVVQGSGGPWLAVPGLFIPRGSSALGALALSAKREHERA